MMSVRTPLQVTFCPSWATGVLCWAYEVGLVLESLLSAGIRVMRHEITSYATFLVDV